MCHPDPSILKLMFSNQLSSPLSTSVTTPTGVSFQVIDLSKVLVVNMGDTKRAFDVVFHLPCHIKKGTEIRSPEAATPQSDTISATPAATCVTAPYDDVM